MFLHSFIYLICLRHSYLGNGVTQSIPLFHSLCNDLFPLSLMLWGSEPAGPTETDRDIMDFGPLGPGPVFSLLTAPLGVARFPGLGLSFSSFLPVTRRKMQLFVIFVAYQPKKEIKNLGRNPFTLSSEQFQKGRRGREAGAKGERGESHLCLLMPLSRFPMCSRFL